VGAGMQAQCVPSGRWAGRAAHISVEQLEGVDVVERERNLRRIVDAARQRVSARHQIVVHVAALDEVEHKTEVVLGLERASEAADEGMLESGERLFLAKYGVHLRRRGVKRCTEGSGGECEGSHGALGCEAVV
jgi:hypothetical protein